MDITDKMMAYEEGVLPFDGVLDLFSSLIKNKMTYVLQGHYGRMASNLIDVGFLDRNGNILEHENTISNNN